MNLWISQGDMEIKNGVKEGEYELKVGDQKIWLTRTQVETLRELAIVVCRLTTAPQWNASANGTPVFNAMVSE